jgi:hypothetical protein
MQARRKAPLSFKASSGGPAFRVRALARDARQTQRQVAGTPGAAHRAPPGASYPTSGVPQVSLTLSLRVNLFCGPFVAVVRRAPEVSPIFEKTGYSPVCMGCRTL